MWTNIDPQLLFSTHHHDTHDCIANAVDAFIESVIELRESTVSVGHFERWSYLLRMHLEFTYP